MTEAALSRVDQFLKARPAQTLRRGHLIFALDATASRKDTWDAACQLQAQMFSEVGAIRPLSLQLVYYRGPRDFGGECKASRWVDQPLELAGLMKRISCEAGHTQIDKVLAHALREAAQHPVDALVFVGDACEEKPDHLLQIAAQLGTLKVPVFMLQEGNDPDARTTFEAIAKASGGAYQRFDAGSFAQLADLLRAIARFSVGGTPALEHGSPTARHLLRQMKSG